jgi:hypothetical protein
MQLYQAHQFQISNPKNSNLKKSKKSSTVFLFSPSASMSPKMPKKAKPQQKAPKNLVKSPKSKKSEKSIKSKKSKNRKASLKSR